MASKKSNSKEMDDTIFVPRAASGRHPHRLYCQNKECGIPLEVSSIPVEYETIIRQVFKIAQPSSISDNSNNNTNTRSGHHLSSGSTKVQSTITHGSNNDTISGSDSKNNNNNDNIHDITPSSRISLTTGAPLAKAAKDLTDLYFKSGKLDNNKKQEKDDSDLSLQQKSSKEKSIPNTITKQQQKEFVIPLVIMDWFRELAAKGDNINFALLLGEVVAASLMSSQTNNSISLSKGLSLENDNEWVGNPIRLPLCSRCLYNTVSLEENHLRQIQMRTNIMNQSLSLLKERVELHNNYDYNTLENISMDDSNSNTTTTSNNNNNGKQKKKNRNEIINTLVDHFSDEASSLKKEIALLQEKIRKEKELKQVKLIQSYKKCMEVEEQLWYKHNNINTVLSTNRDRMYAIRLREEKQRVYLSKIRCLSVYGDAYFIWHRGTFATVNSARLGRLPGAIPDWNEINAALGQLVLILSITAQRLGFVFTKFRLLPMGSFPRIGLIREEASKLTELYYEPSYSFTRSQKFNTALKAFAVCLGELGTYAETTDPSFRLPYHISMPSGEYIGDIPITMGKDMQWTRALKLAAIDIKWIVAWAYKQPNSAI